MSTKEMFKVRSKEDPTKEIAADWQNASELVRHGYWEWVRDGAKEFERAAKAAQENANVNGNVRTVEEEPAEEPAVVVETPATPAVVTEQQAPAVAEATDPPSVPTAPAPMDLEDMTREELFEYGASIPGLTLDKRLGTKNLIVAIKAAQGETE